MMATIDTVGTIVVGGGGALISLYLSIACFHPRGIRWLTSRRVRLEGERR